MVNMFTVVSCLIILYLFKGQQNI